jgi:hypothetical protein
MHGELLGNPRLRTGVTANFHNPGVSIRRATVGLYCAVVDRVYLLVSMRTIALCETHAVSNHRTKSLRTWLIGLNLGLEEA